jgi:hypothetical protein
MSRTLLSLAGFQVITIGRFWVIAEAGGKFLSDAIKLRNLWADFKGALLAADPILIKDYLFRNSKLLHRGNVQSLLNAGEGQTPENLPN